MKIVDLADYIQAAVGIPIFPLAFPSATTAPVDVGTVQFLTSYTKSKGGTQRVNVQMIVRSDTPEKAEKFALDLASHFDSKTNYDIGDYHIIFTDMRTPFPLFVGKDNADHYRYSVSMVLLVDKG